MGDESIGRYLSFSFFFLSFFFSPPPLLLFFFSFFSPSLPFHSQVLSIFFPGPNSITSLRAATSGSFSNNEITGVPWRRCYYISSLLVLNMQRVETKSPSLAFKFEKGYLVYKLAFDSFFDRRLCLCQYERKWDLSHSVYPVTFHQCQKIALCFRIRNVLLQTLTSLKSLHWLLKIQCFHG